MRSAERSVFMLTLEGLVPYLVVSAAFLDFTPLNSSEGSTIALSMVGMGIIISEPAIEPAGKVAVVVNALKSLPSLAGLVELALASTEKSTV